MQCPFCSAPDTRVIDSRLAAEGYEVRRRRECAACSERFTTYEKAELVMPLVRKRHGECEPFDEQKLRRGVNHALYKRPVRGDEIEAGVNRIMHKLRTAGEREIAAGQIGDWVMEELRDLDQVAFVRFASVYRSFEDVNEFRKEIDRLETEPSAELKKLQLDLIDPKSS